MTHEDPVVSVQDLRCSYGGFEAVRGVTFQVPRGQLFALLGTNGAGKTTTMETLEGHRRPTNGRVRVLGMDPHRDRTRVARRTGVVLQESGCAGDLTVDETVRMWAKLTSRPSDPDASIKAVDLEHRRGTRVSQLSGGEKRRLDLAVAILGGPEVLFLDEPTTGLDPESRQRVWDLIRGLVYGGSTIVLTTHYLEEAETLADRLAIMHEGRLAVTGTLHELLSRYPAWISFDVPAGVSWRDLPAVVGEVDLAALSRNRFECRTPALQDDVGAIVDWARDRHLELDHLRAQHASLQEIFTAVSRGAASGPRRDTGVRHGRCDTGELGELGELVEQREEVGL